MAGKKKGGKGRKAQKKGGGGKKRGGGQTNRTARAAMVPSQQLTVYRPALQPGAVRVGVNTMKMVHGMCDPFSDESRGCMHPDGVIIPRLPVRGEILYNLPSAVLQGGTTAGTAAFYWYPCELGASYAYTSLATGGTFSAPTTGYASVISSVWPTGSTLGRRTCSGIKMRVNAVATATAGSVIVTEGFYPANCAVGSMTGVDVRSYTLVPGLEVTCLSRPAGPQSLLPMEFTTAGNPTYNGSGVAAWTGFMFQFQGVPAGVSIDYQIVEACEAFLDSTAATSQYVPQAPQRNDAASQLVDKVKHEVGGILQTGVGAVGENLRTRISQALRIEAPAVARRTGLLALMP